MSNNEQVIRNEEEGMRDEVIILTELPSPHRRGAGGEV